MIDLKRDRFVYCISEDGEEWIYDSEENREYDLFQEWDVRRFIKKVNKIDSERKCWMERATHGRIV